MSQALPGSGHQHDRFDGVFTKPHGCDIDGTDILMSRFSQAVVAAVKAATGCVRAAGGSRRDGGDNARRVAGGEVWPIW